MSKLMKSFPYLESTLLGFVLRIFLFQLSFFSLKFQYSQPKLPIIPLKFVDIAALAPVHFTLQSRADRARTISSTLFTALVI